MTKKRDTPRVDGREKVCGTALYAGDIRLPGLLFGIALRSTVPHALIKSVDASMARRIPGVHAVLTAADLPPLLLGKRLKDIPLLARDRVRFIGEKVAVVAAESREIAEEAAYAIAVEYSDLPAVFDPEEALQPDAPALHPDFESYTKPTEWIKAEWRSSERQQFHLEPRHPNISSEVVFEKGDVREGFERSVNVFEDVFQIPMQHHGFIEPHGCTVAIDSSGKVRVSSCVKDPFDMRQWFFEATGVSLEKIVVMPVRIGGDFGGKGYIMDELLAFFLARACGRPVQMVMSQNEEFAAGIHRHGATIRIKSGLDRDRRLVAREVQILFNNGAYAGYRPRMTLGGTPRAAGCYRISHVRIASVCAYTNQVPCGHMRGPGQPQVTFAVECHTDLIARRLGMDPVAFRQLNVLRDGDEAPLGGIWHSVAAAQVLTRAAEAIGWTRLKKDGVGRGLALTERHTGSGPAAVAVEVNERGQILVRTGVPEVGTGAHTVLQRVVATALTIDSSEVAVLQGDTETGPFDGGSGGSHVTNATGGAALKAAQALRLRLCSLAADFMGWPTGSVELDKGRFICRKNSGRVAFARLAGELAKLQGGLIQEKAEITAEHGDAAGYACHAVEVTVDRETGQVKINRAVAVHDVGYAINPRGLTGQIEGGFSQGLGMALTEDLQLEDGRLLYVNFDGYKIPSLVDMPPLFIELMENRDGPGPFGAKGIGEIAASPTAPALANAVQDAVGVRICDLPISAEKVAQALRAKK
ncbi:MAG: xanthine dehydrogenase family protein molybdopterin-binding subunit [Deltaproteobacteria bacterium]|nr:xanthine dehydrogenase family protein molybdopterin-binding subunit [Deltaproteobacteria bacterium]